MERLIEGFRRFRGTYCGQHRARFERLAARQRPRCAVVACCDSRIDTTLIFDAIPGEDGTLQVDALHVDLEQGELLLYSRRKAP